MPIVDVTLIGEASAAATLATDLARAIGQTLGAAEGTVWVTLHRHPAGDYAENGPPPEPLPVFVRVLARSGDAAERAALAARIADAVAALLRRPAERVHVIFEPEAAGRVHFGGRPSGD
jgi:phenylpyruvate tautomerase PptA (4-oxalocrotonate tautomerase family)